MHEAFHFSSSAFSPRLPNDERLFMILLFSSYMYCLTYVVPYISLTPPWTQHIHLMQWINGGERVSALGPLGTRLGAERTLIPTHPHQIHFLALTGEQRRGQIILSQGKLPIVHAMKQDETWNMLAHNELCVSPLQSSPNFLSFSLILSHLSFSGAITPERQLPWQQQSGFAP